MVIFHICKRIEHIWRGISYSELCGVCYEKGFLVISQGTREFQKEKNAEPVEFYVLDKNEKDVVVDIKHRTPDEDLALYAELQTNWLNAKSK